ncbi:MAG: proteasome accessory factor PafA2 family protein, partial [Acidimicrobiales bacterium]|nr:proteasome accessory factor PafA2 family protein [Acidimicrobiales bacterium]
IINTRDEPHADAQKYRRLHVIVGDANPSEVATFLKVGTTAFVLSLIEDDALPRTFAFASPVAAMRQVSYDVGLRRPIPLADGTTVTALEVQWELLERSRKWAEEHGYEAVGGDGAAQVLDEWEAVLTGLEADPATVADRVDWVAKQRLLEGYMERHGVGWDDQRLAGLALQYHDLRPHRSVADRVGLRRITTDDEVAAATTTPPDDTRAYFRGRCLERWAPQVVAANWDSIVFDVGESSLRRVPMMEPLRGTRAHVGSVVDESADPAELLARLSG